MVGTKEKVPVRILRDTGATESFILASVLPFSFQTYTGNNVLLRGIGLNVLSVPLHKVVLMSDLVVGEVELGVRPCLPMDGLDVILGNNLAGDRVWQKAPPSLVVSPTPGHTEKIVEDANNFPEGFVSCAVTRSMTKSPFISVAQSDLERAENPIKIPPSLSVSREELALEQRADSSLDDMFGRLLPPDMVKNMPSGYYLEGELLVRKWVPHAAHFIRDLIIQIVVPKKFRNLVLQTSHDASGHLGVKKTYQLIRKFFFLAQT